MQASLAASPSRAGGRESGGDSVKASPAAGGDSVKGTAAGVESVQGAGAATSMACRRRRPCCGGSGDALADPCYDDVVGRSFGARPVLRLIVGCRRAEGFGLKVALLSVFGAETDELHLAGAGIELKECCATDSGSAASSARHPRVRACVESPEAGAAEIMEVSMVLMTK